MKLLMGKIVCNSLPICETNYILDGRLFLRRIFKHCHFLIQLIHLFVKGLNPDIEVR